MFCLTTPSRGEGAAPEKKRNITEKDLFDFVWIGEMQVSPDGARVVFVRVAVNEKREGYETSLWMVPTAGGEEPHRLTTGNHDAAPRWSPDGRERRQARAGSALHVADEWRGCVSIHFSAERRGWNRLVARRKNDCI